MDRGSGPTLSDQTKENISDEADERNLSGHSTMAYLVELVTGARKELREIHPSL